MERKGFASKRFSTLHAGIRRIRLKKFIRRLVTESFPLCSRVKKLEHWPTMPLRGHFQTKVPRLCPSQPVLQIFDPGFGRPINGFRGTLS